MSWPATRANGVSLWACSRFGPTISHVFLLVADTPANRIAIAEIRELLRPDLPLDSRSILSALAKGRCPGAGGILFL